MVCDASRRFKIAAKCSNSSHHVAGLIGFICHYYIYIISCCVYGLIPGVLCHVYIYISIYLYIYISIYIYIHIDIYICIDIYRYRYIDI